jgi:hypothetical protein
VDVLDSFDRSTDLNVDVAVILGKEKRIMLVGEGIGVAMAQLFKRSAIVGPGMTG